MKINRIEVNNLKAISEQTADFNGCSAIITAGNDEGKTTLLRGLIDRFRGERPDIILKEGEKKGYSVMELTDGSIIEWRFTDKTEAFSYTTKEGMKITQGVLKAVGEKYFGIKFDIDKFLLATPKVGMTMLGKLVGLDFEDVDGRYKLAYANRTTLNQILATVSKNVVVEPIKVDAPDMDALNEKLSLINAQNEGLKSEWISVNEKSQVEIRAFNNAQDNLDAELEFARIKYTELIEMKAIGGIWAECINYKKVEEVFNSFTKAKAHKVFKATPEPTYLPTTEVDQEIATANFNLGTQQNYERDLEIYNAWVKEGTKAKKDTVGADKLVKDIEAEKNKMINGAKIPEEFEFTEDGILYNGLPLSSTQLSSSAKYIAALKLGAMALGVVKTMHFDASFLDKNSLSKIQDWAKENDLQLLIERPDFLGCGEIKYEII